MSRDKRSYRSTQRTRRGAVTTFGSRTDVGCVRDHNEDSLVVAPPLFAVADGMGGHAAGEVASEIAVNVLAELAPKDLDGAALEHAVEEANHEIIRAARDGRGREGMGTTLTACMLENERLIIAQVGDSRAYLLHHGKLQQLTRDHSLMADMVEAGQLTPEEARHHPQRSVITRALGSDPNTRPDMYEINVETGDRLLVCSDGLSSMIEDEQIEAVMRRVPDPQRCASQLVNEAIAAGGHDNVTVIVSNVTGFAEKRRRKLARKTKFSVALVLVLFLAILGGGAWGVHTWLHTTAYLGEDNGKVAVYEGIPADFLGMHLYKQQEVADVSVDSLQPGTAARLQEGIRVDNMDAAHDLVQQYRDEADQRSKPEGSEQAASTQANGTATTSDAAANAPAVASQTGTGTQR